MCTLLIVFCLFGSPFSPVPIFDARCASSLLGGGVMALAMSSPFGVLSRLVLSYVLSLALCFVWYALLSFSQFHLLCD